MTSVSTISQRSARSPTLKQNFRSKLKKYIMSMTIDDGAALPSSETESPLREVYKMEEERRRLWKELKRLRTRRQEVGRSLEVETAELSLAYRQLNNTSQEHAQLLEEYKSHDYAQRESQKTLARAQKWNVTNDCFFIWHRGPFATINHLRLGSGLPQSPFVFEESAQNPSTNEEGATTGRVGKLGYSLGFSAESPSPSVHQNYAPDKVPWVEINSALGMVALLLSTLERKPHSGIQYQNELIPLGSTSRIGIRSGHYVSYYNLFSDDTFQLFGRRNFNMALNGLLGCVADAARAVQKLDRTIALPHPVDSQGRGDGTIGGLSIAFGPDGDRWTRALKYLLIDIKWLVAFTAKHVDR